MIDTFCRHQTEQATLPRNPQVMTDPCGITYSKFPHNSTPHEPHIYTTRAVLLTKLSHNF